MGEAWLETPVHLCIHNCKVMSRSMELQQTISTLWISLLNTVFASLAFMVWYLVRVEDQSGKLQEEDIVKIVEEEKDKEIPDTNEEKHLYVKSDLRTATNSLQYTEYCGYDAKTSTSIKATENEEYKEIPKVENPAEKKVVKKEVILAEPFKWPRQDDVIESMRAMQSSSSQISNDLMEKLSANGILRKPSEHEETSNTGVKLSELARMTGKSLPKKQVYVIWDVFQATSRPGLEHTSSPDGSPSPKNRKPVMKNMIKKNNAGENKMKNKLNNSSPDSSPSPKNRKPVKMMKMNAGDIHNKMNKQTRKPFFNDLKPQNCVNLVRAI